MKKTVFRKKHIFLALLTIGSFFILLYFCFRQWAILPIVCLFIHTCSLLLLYQDALIEQDPEEWEEADEWYDDPLPVIQDDVPVETTDLPAESAAETEQTDICGIPLKSLSAEIRESLFTISSEGPAEAVPEKQESQPEIEEPLPIIQEEEALPFTPDDLAKAFLATKQNIIEMDLIAAAKDAMDSLSSFAESQKIKLHLSTTCDSLMMYADPDSIRILFRNIIDNSIKYMGRPGHMIITISLLGDDIFLILKDTGKGLSEDETLHVFELNFQGSNRVSGNGLGLTQTKMIVEAFGGTIYAKSSLNNGMAIYIQLPVSSSVKEK